MALLIGSIFVQVMLIIHRIKTRRNTIWIWVLALPHVRKAQQDWLAEAERNA